MLNYYIECMAVVGRRTCITVKAKHSDTPPVVLMVMVLLSLSQWATMTYLHLLRLLSTRTRRVHRAGLLLAGIYQWTRWWLVEREPPSLRRQRHLLHWQAMLVFFRLRPMSLKKKAAQDDGSAAVLNVLAVTLLVVVTRSCMQCTNVIGQNNVMAYVTLKMWHWTFSKVTSAKWNTLWTAELL